MPRKRKSARSRSGLSIEDLHVMRGVAAGKHWRYRIRDVVAGAYLSATFDDDPKEDFDRRKPGCAAGDRWAAEKKPKVDLQLETSGEAKTAAIAGEYLQSLRDLRRHPTHIREVERVLGDLATAAPNLKAKAFRAQVEHWRRSLRARATNDPKEGQARGMVRRTDAFDLAAVTVNRYVLHVRTLVAYAVSMGYLPRNPLVRFKNLEEPDRIKETFSVEELRTLIAARDYGNPVWMWAALMALTGCRANEALHLRWQDISITANTVSVRYQPGVYDLKRAKERSIPLQLALADILQAHPARRDLGWIVDDEHTRTANNKTRDAALKRLFKAHSIPAAGRTPHSFRHSYAALMVASREDVFSICRAMGHRDLAMTEHYSREAAGYRPTVEVEGWKPGELRLGGKSDAGAKSG